MGGPHVAHAICIACNAAAAPIRVLNLPLQACPEITALVPPRYFFLRHFFIVSSGSRSSASLLIMAFANCVNLPSQET